MLALASRSFPSDKCNLAFGDVEQGLTLEGLVGLIDPPRQEVIAAIAECRNAGITVKIITGDHAATASGIAGQIGLDRPDAVATGDMLENLDDAELRSVVGATSVFARTSPEHKLRLVEAMQAQGRCCRHDGRRRERRTRFETGRCRCRHGRQRNRNGQGSGAHCVGRRQLRVHRRSRPGGPHVYDNLTKVIGWTLPTSGGVSLIIVAALLLGLTMPITPVQILWINMVTAIGLGLVLAFEPAEPDIMQRPPRPARCAAAVGISCCGGSLFVSVLFALGALGVFAFAEAAAFRTRRRAPSSSTRSS